MQITFTGKSSHAAAFPWDGLNALDAAVMCYQSISVMRQQFKPTWRVHGKVHNIRGEFHVFPSPTVQAVQLNLCACGCNTPCMHIHVFQWLDFHFLLLLKKNQSHEIKGACQISQNRVLYLNGAS